MKTRTFFKTLVACTVGAAFTSSAFTQDAAPVGKTVRILTVGNSFSQNATKHLKQIVDASGNTLVHGSIVVGGASLELHANKALKHLEDPKSMDGVYANERSLFQYLKDEKWDYVTIQQASIKSHDYANHQPFGDQLAKIIREHAPQAELLIHQTWAYRSDDPRFTPKLKNLLKPNEPETQKAMYEGLKKAYAQLGEAVNARIIPVGDAFWRADNDPKFGYKKDDNFDFKTAKKGDLPDQTHSIHTGWRWAKTKADPKKITLAIDGHHANTAGEFLGGCVWFEFLYGEDVRTNTYVPEGVDPEYAKFLREVAHKVVQAQKKA